MLLGIGLGRCCDFEGVVLVGCLVLEGQMGQAVSRELGGDVGQWSEIYAALVRRRVWHVET